MHRGLLLFVAAGLLSVLAGCHHCAGRCDCQVYPIEHGTPSPIVKPGPIVSPPLQPIAPISAQ
ncbi:MAG: hypothetical protein ACRELF_13975 [Gemmataceae bacterium]